MTTSNQPDTGGIPDFLKRDAKADQPKPEATKAAALTSTAPAKPDRTAQIAAAATKVKASKSQANKDAAKHLAKAKPAKPAKPAVEPEDAEDDGEASLPKSIVPARYKTLYAAHNDTCGKPLSLALKDATTHASKEQAGRVVLDVDALWRIAAQNHIDTAKYVGLNNGQKRMNVYNRMVGLLNSGKDVRIGKQVFKAEDHKPTTAPKKAAKANKAAAKALGIPATA